jgi:putative alpha-1,2-mannosidase
VLLAGAMAQPAAAAAQYYNWLGQPWKTQRIVRKAMNSYSWRPDGMPGNDDTGTMSAWYVLAALGLYHAAPGSTPGSCRARSSNGR